MYIPPDFKRQKMIILVGYKKYLNVLYGTTIYFVKISLMFYHVIYLTRSMMVVKHV